MKDRNSKLKNEILQSGTSFICEAHNGISAKIVEEAGFSGIWASGLSISAQYGVRDNNEASWTQVLDAVEFMADATSIPILVDGDTGFGNFNNFRKFVRKLEQVGASGVCIEDKLFPKKNSFIDGHKQELAEIDEFCGKIRAGKDYLLDPNFTIVARVEALIAGWGVNEAIKRACAYSDAGADAILIHSAKKDASEIFEFMDLWDGRCPVVIVPTTYYKTNTDLFIEKNIRLVIWANHMIRSSVKTMQETASKLFENETLIGLEDSFVPVSEIFRLQNNSELEEAESRYLPMNKSAEVFLLSGGGKDIRKSLQNSDLNVERYVKSYRNHNISKVNLLVEGEKESDDNLFDSVTYIDGNTSSEIETLSFALEKIKKSSGDILIAYADTLFETKSLLDYREFEDFDAIILGSYYRPNKFQRKDLYDVIHIQEDFDSEFLTRFVVKNINVQRMIKADEFLWSGLLLIPGKSKSRFIAILEDEIILNKTNGRSITDLINSLISNQFKVGLRITFTRWLEFGDSAIRVTG